MSDVFEAAKAYAASGVSVIPIGAEKAPVVTEWKPFQQRIAETAELARWWQNNRGYGVGVVGGKVSGNLELIDFDDPAAYDEWCALVADYDTFDILSTMPLVSTPKGGKHLYYRCNVPVESNKKLAFGVKPDGSRGNIRIETRGEGGYVVAPPSPGSCHPSGKPYRLERGDIANIPVIDETEREVLLAFARMLTLHVDASAAVGSSPKPRQGQTAATGDKPGDDYNHRGDYEALLERHGWHRIRNVGDKVMWRRPGKSKGISATSNYGGSRLFYVFSSNAAPFDADQSYSPFGVYAVLECGGDYQAAARKLGSEGFGAPPTGQATSTTTRDHSKPMNPAPVEDIDAETATIGAMLADRKVVGDVRAVCVAEDFTANDRRELFEVICHLDDTRKPLDRVIVSNELDRRGKLGTQPGQIPPDALAKLFTFHGAAANAAHYAAIVAECGSRRRLSLVLSNHLAKSQSADCPVAEVRDSLMADIVEASTKGMVRGFKSLDEQREENYQLAVHRRENPHIVTGVGTGIEAFDLTFGRLQESDLIIFAARPAMGKTAAALFIAEHIASKERKPVAVFSLEMSARQLTDRLVCGKALINSMKLRSNNLDAFEWDRYQLAQKKLQGYPLHINDSTDVTPEYMRSELRRFLVRHGSVGLVVVDYLQLMRTARKTDNRTQEVGEVARGLKSVAREFNVPVIALAQLSREVEKRENKRPILSDLRESGSIEAEADMIVFLYREKYYQLKEDATAPKNLDATERLEMIVGKYRNGATGYINVGFIPEHSIFKTWANTNDLGPTGI